MASSGAVYYLESTSLTETGAFYTHNAAMNGGLFKCLNCVLTLSSSVIAFNYAYVGGVLYLDNQGTVLVSDTAIYNNTVLSNGGVFYVAKSSTQVVPASTLTLSSCYNVSENYAGQQGGLLYLDNPYTKVYLKNSLVYNIQAGEKGGLLSVAQGSLVSVSNMQLTDVFSKDGSIMYSTSATVSLSLSSAVVTCNSSYLATDALAMITAARSLTTTAFYLSNTPTVSISSSTFTQCGFASLGGVFYLVSVAAFTDKSSTYKLNAALNAGVIACSGCYMQVTNSKFISNRANVAGVV